VPDDKANSMTLDEYAMTRRAMIGSTMAAVAGAAACARPRLAGTARSLTLAELIRRNTLARGGAAALDRMHSMVAEVEVSEGGHIVGGPYAANKEGLVRVDIYVGGKNVYSEGVDRAGVWLWTGGPGPAQPSVAAGAANALTNGAEDKLFGWNRFTERGHKLVLMPPALLDGINYQVVQVRYSTGQISYFYVNPATWQAERRRDERAYHPDMNQTKQRIESRYFDFVAVAGVVASRQSVDIDLDTGKTLSSGRTLGRRINPTVAADYFDRNTRAPATRPA
jgi:hypothetical protein